MFIPYWMGSGQIFSPILRVFLHAVNHFFAVWKLFVFSFLEFEFRECTLTLEPHDQPFFALVILQIASCIFALGL
jgi:hypothetical protein